MALYNRANFAETTLAAAITTTDGVEATVTSGAAFPAVPFLVTIGTEILKCTDKGAGDAVWVVTRGEQGSTAATHLNGAKVENNITAGDLDDIALAQMADLAQDKIIGRATASTGVPEAIDCTAAGRALLDDAAASNQVTTLGFKSTAAAISTRLMGWKVFDDATAVTIGDGKVIFSVPPDLNGMNLVSVFASVSTVSSSGTPEVTIYNLTDSTDMLSTSLTIDATEYDSHDPASAAVIDTAHDDVATGDRLEINVDTAGTGTKGLFVVLGFSA